MSKVDYYCFMPPGFFPIVPIVADFEKAFINFAG